MSVPAEYFARVWVPRPARYGRVRVTVQPVADPVTLAEAQEQTRLDDADLQSGLLAQMISAATRYVEGVTDHAMVQRTICYTVAGFPANGRLPLAMAPFLSIVDVRYLDASENEQVLDPALYRIAADSDRLPATLVLKTGQSWPVTAIADDAVRVNYIVGYPSTTVDGITDAGQAQVPGDLKQAILLMVADLDINREAKNVQTLYVNEALDNMLALYVVPRV